MTLKNHKNESPWPRPDLHLPFFLSPCQRHAVFDPPFPLSLTTPCAVRCCLPLMHLWGPQPGPPAVASWAGVMQCQCPRVGRMPTLTMHPAHSFWGWVDSSVPLGSGWWPGWGAERRCMHAVPIGGARTTFTIARGCRKHGGALPWPPARRSSLSDSRYDLQMRKKNSQQLCGNMSMGNEGHAGGAATAAAAAAVQCSGRCGAQVLDC